MQKLLKAVEQGLTRSALHRAAMADGAAPRDPPVPDTQVAVVAVTPAVLDSGPQSSQSFMLDKPLRESRDEFEKAYFEYHLARENGSMTRVAEKTGLERTHLYRKLKQLGVDLSRGKRSVA
jgi:DNA-binding NtrC family response regulator